MKRNQKRIFSTRRLVLMAALTAMYIVLMGFLSLKVSDTLRISFETVPLALAGMWLGPVGGVIVALVSDFLGAVLFYGSWFPLIGLGPALFAAMCGWGVKYVFRSDLSETKDAWKVITITVVAGIINSFLVGVVTTTLYQMIIIGKEGAFGALATVNFMSRLAGKPVAIAAVSILTAVVHRTVYQPVIGRIIRRG